MKVSKSPKNPRKQKNNAKLSLSFPHLYILEASAGSGKTKRLAERYVDFLLHYSRKAPLPFNFRNILAITFTNEAAVQMKQEILKTLKVEALLKKRGNSSATLQIVDEIIRNFSDFSVRTIDSFVHSLLVASSLELKLPPDYEIMPQPQPYLEYVLDAFLDEIIDNQEIRQLFLDFLNHFLVIESQKSWNVKTILLGLLKKFYREENGRAKLFRQLGPDLDLNQAEQELKKEIRQFLRSLSVYNDINQKFAKGLSSSLEESGPSFIKGINRYIHKALIPGSGILNKSAAEPSQALNRQWQELNVQYNNYAHAFTWLRYSLYLKVFVQFRQRLEDFKKDKRIVFLDELNRKARAFLTSEGLLPAEIYYKLSLVIYHYLIDEFQDTNILQWENIQALVEDALSKGGSLFYVGDKKQAIYRFRGGEVELFDLIKARFQKQVGQVYEDVMLSNYRSREAIVEFNNRVFARANLENFISQFRQLNQDFQNKILDVFKDSQQKAAGKNPDGGYVRMEIIECDNKQELQDYVNISLNRVIAEISGRFNYRDILILVRDNKEAEALADFLLRKGYPVSASRTISIRENYLIQQIISLLRFLNSPIDELSFANFILGDIFLKATHIDFRKLELWMQEGKLNKREGALYRQFRSAFEGIWQEYLQYLFGAVGFLPVYDLVEAIFKKFKLEENFNYLSAFLQRLLEIVNGLQQEGRNSLSEFLDWFEAAEDEDLFVRLPVGLDAIRILTIHKAKGLSAPVVILPYAALEIKAASGAFEASKVVHETPEGLYLLYLQKEICQHHPRLAGIYQREYFQSFLDELNCLYVAFTRAESELYIFVPAKVNRTSNPLINLLFSEEEKLKEFGKKSAGSLRRRPLDSEVTQRTSPVRRLAQHNSINILKEQLIHRQEVISSHARRLISRGEALHYLLAQISPADFLASPASYARGIEDVCRSFSYPDSAEIKDCLFDFLQQPEVREFFVPGFMAFNEKEVIDKRGNLKRIDRLIFKEDKILIIDYKTGEGYQKEHSAQIEEYAALIKEIYPGKQLQGYLVYVDAKQVCKVLL